LKKVLARRINKIFVNFMKKCHKICVQKIYQNFFLKKFNDINLLHPMKILIFGIDYALYKIKFLAISYMAKIFNVVQNGK